MKIVKTIKFKLVASAEELLPTILNYTNAYNFIAKVGFENKQTNSIELHKLTYRETRKKFNLPSQLACSARAKASESLKLLKKKIKTSAICPRSRQQSIRYDQRSFTLFLQKEEVSLLTCSGRKKYKIIVSDYHKEYFENWKQCSADLVIRNKQVYLHIVFEQEVKDTISNGNFIGLDRGINNIAVVSNNKFYTGAMVKETSARYRNLRKKLQKKGTKSAKRHLRKLSGKEKRFKADVNHQISKQIIESLCPGDTLVLEDLSGIRNRKLRKEMRVLVYNWSFYQLEQFLIYKGKAKGINVIFADPAYTSQTCSACGFCDKSNRKGSLFLCKQCAFELNADLNASRNVRNKALESYMHSNEVVVNQPIVSSVIGEE